MSELNTGNVQEFAEIIFTKPPKDACAHELNVDTDGDVASLLEIMVILFSYGTRILFARNNVPVDITNMDQDKLALLQKYYNSFGMQFFISVSESTFTGRGHFSMNGRNLKDNNFKLYRNGRCYQLSFDFIPKPDRSHM